MTDTGDFVKALNRAVKTLDEIQQILREQKPYLAEKFGVEIIGVFGSYARQI
jgi:predicted nucleotidyltransferase